MNKSKKMQVNRKVTKTANFILGGYVGSVYVYIFDGYVTGSTLRVHHPYKSEVMYIDFDEDDYLASGYRFYSPLKRSKQETLELLQDSHSHRVDFSDYETEINQALHDWAFKWKTGGLTGSGYTRPKFGNARHRRYYRLKMKEYEKQHTYSYLFYDEEGEVHEMH